MELSCAVCATRVCHTAVTVHIFRRAGKTDTEFNYNPRGNVAQLFSFWGRVAFRVVPLFSRERNARRPR